MAEEKKDKKSKKDEVLNKNVIEINPIIQEETSKKVVMTFGRMNPPTIGHEKLIAKIREVARKEGAMPQVFLSHSQDAKKNPLSYEDKYMIAKEAFGALIQKTNAKTIIEVMKQLSGKYSKVFVVVGQDRVAEFEKLLNTYNKKEYDFDSINVVSAGERDPDAEGVEGMSASKMREAAKAGDSVKFKTGLPKKLQQHASDIYDMVRAGMKLSEEAELEETVLTLDQRRKRALVMRRYERKMQAARERLKNRVASNQKLIGRARKKAIQILRASLAGAKGVDYADLSPSEKIMIDQRVEKRKRAIGKIAARLLPKVRQAELQRVATLHREELEENSKYYSGLSQSTAEKRKSHFAKHGKMDDDNPNAYKPAPGDATAETKPSVYTKRYHMMFTKEGSIKLDRRFRAFRTAPGLTKEELNDTDLLMMIEEVAASMGLEEGKEMEGLKKKAEKSGISYGILKSVFDRGVAAWRTGHRPGTTPQQWGYARVNSFITGGKTRTTADADLAKKINEAFEEFFDEGVNDPSIFKAVFLAGGPGSGKSFIVGKTALTALGFKVINSDDIFERALAKAGLTATPEDIYSPKGQEIRGGAKELTGKKMDLALNGRLGLVIDGTGKDYDKIEKQAAKLKKLGYEVAMIFVNTDLNTAKTRNRQRARSLPDSEVESMWNGVQKNLGKFQNFFGTKMYIIDNSEGSNFEGAVTSVYRKISAWAKALPTNPETKSWLASQQSSNKIKNFHAYHEAYGAGFEGTDDLVQNYKAATPGEKGTPKKPKITDGINEAFENMMEAEESDVEITASKMKDFEKFVDRMFEKFKIDFEFTKHFGDRMNDDRNSPKIKLKELADLIKKIYAKNGNPLKGKAGAELVVKDLQSDLNMPIVVKYDEKNDEIDIVAKTIMRKKNFSTPNPVVKY